MDTTAIESYIGNPTTAYKFPTSIVAITSSEDCTLIEGVYYCYKCSENATAIHCRECTSLTALTFTDCLADGAKVMTQDCDATIGLEDCNILDDSADTVCVIQRAAAIQRYQPVVATGDQCVMGVWVPACTVLDV